ncbi:hypothetical protein [Radicibacter daui]|uniref:hypothetical protein n=1 Tax=Radicibacter daui TaxID=3064829 RepID=UPI0040469124
MVGVVDFALSDAVEAIAVETAPAAEARGLRLLADIAPDLPEALSGDFAAIETLLRAFAAHALVRTEAGGISLRARPASHFAEAADGRSFLRLEVSDTGTGYTQEQLATLFTAGADGPVPAGPAALTLARCRVLARAAGGEAGADSIEGLGCCYWAEIPISVRDPSPLAPAIAIEDARLVVAGFGQRWTEGLRSTFKVAGLGLALWAVEDDDPVELAARLAVGAAEPVLVLLRVGAAVDDVGALCARLAAASKPAVILACQEGQRAALEASGLPGVSAIITLPLRRQPLWRAIALAMGRTEA